MSECPEPIEERTDPRFKARIAIFNGPHQKRIVTNYSVNMSAGGVFIETEEVRPVDTLLLLKFKLPGNVAIITCTARVAWVNEPLHAKKQGAPAGMGLQFIDLSLKDMYVIRDYLYKGDLVPIW